MNIVFGIWRPQGPVVTTEELGSMAKHTRRFAPDGEWLRVSSEIGFGVQALYTHERSHLDAQPVSDVAGNVVVYDGRLDNHCTLSKDLGLSGDEVSDSVIILSAYRRWSKDCFAHLIGDWSLVLWDFLEQKLLFARDHAGTRTLHLYQDQCGIVKWSTFIDSFIGTTLLDSFDQGYIARYLAMLPSIEKSPYNHIISVLPGHCLEVRRGSTLSAQFWTPMVYERLRYGSDKDYETQFSHLFEQAVARRTGPGAPILAQLSGGMDSTSIVCVSDHQRASTTPQRDTLDTISYFDDSDPAWNERPYFTLVEEKRNKQGLHVDSARYREFLFVPPNSSGESLYPGTDLSNLKHDKDLEVLTAGRGYRSMLSGIGGDELTGGNADPYSELADDLVNGRLIAAFRSALKWSLATRRSLADCFSKTIGFTIDRYSLAYLDRLWLAVPWLTQRTTEICHEAIRSLPLVTLGRSCWLPSAVDNSRMWWFMLRTQPHLRPGEVVRYEYLYPFLDRDLVDFLLRVPPEQLVRPGRRRSLMRRALKNVVPVEILERRRKAFLLQSPLEDISQHSEHFSELIDTSILADLDLINKVPLKASLDDTVRGHDLRWWPAILRVMRLEIWLRVRNHTPIWKSSSQISVDGTKALNGHREESRSRPLARSL